MFRAEFIYRLVRSIISTIIFVAFLIFADYLLGNISLFEGSDWFASISSLIAKAYILSHITGFAKVFITRKKNPRFLATEQSDFSLLLTYFISWNVLSFFILVLINSFSGDLSFNVNLLDIAIISLLSLVGLSMNISLKNKLPQESHDG